MEHPQHFKMSREFRRMARQQLKGKWGLSVLLVFIFWIISMMSAIPYVGAAIEFIIGGALLLGLKSCFIKIVRGEKLQLENLFSGFKNFGSALLLQLLNCVFVFLWSLISVIPLIAIIVLVCSRGISDASYDKSFIVKFIIACIAFVICLIPAVIAQYRYFMAYYILNDNPDVGAYKAIVKSKKMMKGYKWKLFCLHLSFIGWIILGIISLGIGFLLIIPYVETATADFYENLKDLVKFNLD